MTCEHGFIGPCMVCDGCGQAPDSWYEEGLRTQRAERDEVARLNGREPTADHCGFTYREHCNRPRHIGVCKTHHH